MGYVYALVFSSELQQFSVLDSKCILGVGANQSAGKAAKRRLRRVPHVRVCTSRSSVMTPATS